MPFCCSCKRVSTHSRPKAAGETSRRIGCAPKFQHTAARRRLGRKLTQCDPGRKFQHTAARRRLVIKRLLFFSFLMVSTHSRPKAAGFSKAAIHGYVVVSTHSRPKAAGPSQEAEKLGKSVSTHSRPKAAGRLINTTFALVWFQHTAARRRLGRRRVR